MHAPYLPVSECPGTRVGLLPTKRVKVTGGIPNRYWLCPFRTGPGRCWRRSPPARRFPWRTGTCLECDDDHDNRRQRVAQLLKHGVTICNWYSVLGRGSRHVVHGGRNGPKTDRFRNFVLFFCPFNFDVTYATTHMCRLFSIHNGPYPSRESARTNAECVCVCVWVEGGIKLEKWLTLVNNLLLFIIVVFLFYIYHHWPISLFYIIYLTAYMSNKKQITCTVIFLAESSYKSIYYIIFFILADWRQKR